MRWKYLSKTEYLKLKKERQLKEYAESQRWQLVFLWWPTRVGPNEIGWLERMTRINRNINWNAEQDFPKGAEWEYGPVSNYLMQPGVKKIVEENVMQAAAMPNIPQGVTPQQIAKALGLGLGPLPPVGQGVASVGSLGSLMQNAAGGKQP